MVTPHGSVATPAFMPVGTQASVKGMLPEAVRAGGAEIVLGNTYHLMLRPGADASRRWAACTNSMNWPHAILTDSGGFQVMSLSGLRKVEERAVTFRSHLDGPWSSSRPSGRSRCRPCSAQTLPCSSTNACVCRRRAPISSAPCGCRCAGPSARSAPFEGVPAGRALFGIVQGGDDPGLRLESLAALVAMDFSGYAIGGLAVGEPPEVMLRTIEGVAPALPAAGRTT